MMTSENFMALVSCNFCKSSKAFLNNLLYDNVNSLPIIKACFRTSFIIGVKEVGLYYIAFSFITRTRLLRTHPFSNSITRMN